MSKQKMNFKHGLLAGAVVGMAAGMMCRKRKPAHPFRKKMNHAADMIGCFMDGVMK